MFPYGIISQCNIHPVAYKNNIIDQYIDEKNKTKEDTRKRVTELIPFLELEKDEVTDIDNFHLEKVHNADGLRSEGSLKTISDEQYQNLLKSETEK